MKKKITMVLIALLAVGTLCFANGQTEGKPFPAKEVTIVVPYSPGGASDTVTRIIAKNTESALGVPVIVTNKTGASGSIGMDYVRKSTPDGYTISYMPVESTMVSALGYTDLAPADFDFVAGAMTLSAALTVRADAPWDSVEEFLAYAKANPGKLNIGNSGTGSIWHIAAASIEESQGVQFNHVPFEGAAPAIAALLGGHIEALTVSDAEVLPNVKNGDFKVLAVMGNERSATLSEVPTLKELGIDVAVFGWGGFAVPKGTPDDVKAILGAAFKVGIGSADFAQLCKERGFTQKYMTGKEIQEFAQEQYEYYSKLIPKLGIH